jgi:hypothetical protein
MEPAVGGGGEDADKGTHDECPLVGQEDRGVHRRTGLDEADREHEGDARRAQSRGEPRGTRRRG